MILHRSAQNPSNPKEKGGGPTHPSTHKFYPVPVLEGLMQWHTGELSVRDGCNSDVLILVVEGGGAVRGNSLFHMTTAHTAGP